MAFIYGMVGGSMEMITLLKANIRHKKGAFISILVLMCLVSMAITTILSLKSNCVNTVEQELEHVDAGNVLTFIKNFSYSEEQMEEVRNHELVDRVVEHTAVASDKSTINGASTGNGWFAQKLRPEIKLFNSALTGYEDTVPALEKGEIYLTQGIKTNMPCEVGDTVSVKFHWETYEFVIKGFVVEPCNGASVMGWKQVFISDEDFEWLLQEAIAHEDPEKEISAYFHLVQIYKSEACELSDGKFARKLNLDTGIVDSGTGSLTSEQSIHYTTLFPEVIGSILMVFIGVLMVVVLIVMGNNISTSMEMEYVNLGILKAQGFTKGKIRLIYILQYMIAQSVGAVIGFVLALPLVDVLGNVFQPIMAMRIINEPQIVASALIILCMLIMSVGFVYYSTRKIADISPVRAISGGRKDIHFDSRIKAPITKRGLVATLAFRQFTSNKRQYVGIILIVSLLVFFMMTIMGLGNVLTSENAMKSMGIIYAEVTVTFPEGVTNEWVADVESVIEEVTEIDGAYYMQTGYMAVDGEKMYCTVYHNPDAIIGILKGRAPLYDNEIVVTEILADALELELGDTVTVSLQDRREEYLISGLYQDMSDTGMCFAMSAKAAQKIGMEKIRYGHYDLKDATKGKEIIALLQERFGEEIVPQFNGADMESDDTYTLAVNVMKVVIYSFSTIFALIVVVMVCSKAFLREKVDIGIYKAMGFTGNRLRIQFAMRFLIIALIGAVIGMGFSVLLSGRLLGKLLRLIGISNFVVDYSVTMFALPVALICVCFFVFAYLVAGKVRKVEVRELVVE